MHTFLSLFKANSMKDQYTLNFAILQSVQSSMKKEKKKITRNLDKKNAYISAMDQFVQCTCKWTSVAKCKFSPSSFLFASMKTRSRCLQICMKVWIKFNLKNFKSKFKLRFHCFKRIIRFLTFAILLMQGPTKGFFPRLSTERRWAHRGGSCCCRAGNLIG